jgi:hypothetical protein
MRLLLIYKERQKGEHGVQGMQGMHAATETQQG